MREKVMEVPILKKMSVGFTLAEVLITLGIIGVVAALTIPTLVHNYQSKQLETAFKKAYSTLSQAYALDCKDRGNSAPDFRQLDDKVEFLNYFKSVSSTVPTTYKALSYDKSFSTGNGYCGYVNTYFRALSDGAFIGFVAPYSNSILQVDTNGAKPPNRIGYDVFIFAPATKTVYTSWVDVPTDLHGPNNLVLGAAVNYLDNQHLGLVPNSQFCAPISKGGIAFDYMSGNTCTYFAIQDQCPWDSTKSYWATLP